MGKQVHQEASRDGVEKKLYKLRCIKRLLIHIITIVTTMDICQLTPEQLYQRLCESEFNAWPYEKRNLGEEMTLVKISSCGYWRSMFFMDHRVQRAFIFIDAHFRLLTVNQEDINWESLEKLPQKAKETATELYFGYPSFIYSFNQGVALVCWQLVPDGRYYMDEDGYGMEDDDEVNIYGVIDRTGKVIVPFRLTNDSSEHQLMLQEAIQILQARDR